MMHPSQRLTNESYLGNGPLLKLIGRTRQMIIAGMVLLGTSVLLPAVAIMHLVKLLHDWADSCEDGEEPPQIGAF